MRARAELVKYSTSQLASPLGGIPVWTGWLVAHWVFPPRVLLSFPSVVRIAHWALMLTSGARCFPVELKVPHRLNTLFQLRMT